jgi:DNA-binding transcriptional regulator WhiA
MESMDRGFFLGATEDGTIYLRKSKYAYTIEIEQKVREWLVYVQDVLSREYSKKSNLRKTSRGYYRLIVYSKAIYNEVLDFRKDYRKLFLSSGAFQIGFLQGIYDAEGTVHCNRFQIRISSKQEDTMRIIENILNDLGISTGKVYKDLAVYVLPFYGRENLKKFRDIIGFRHPEKKQRLSDLLS